MNENKPLPAAARGPAPCKMTEVQRKIERIHHRLMDLRDSTPHRRGLITREREYLKAYFSAYKTSSTTGFYAAVERFRQFLQQRYRPIHWIGVKAGVCHRKDAGVDVITEMSGPATITHSAVASFRGNITCTICRKAERLACAAFSQGEPDGTPPQANPEISESRIQEGKQDA